MTSRKLMALISVIAAVSISAPAFAEDGQSAEFNKADALYKKLKLKEAEAAFREIIRKEPDNAKAHQRLGAATRQGRLSTSLATRRRPGSWLVPPVSTTPAGSSPS